MKTLETERLYLRPFSSKDLDEIHRLIYADPEVAPAWAGQTRTIDEIRASFAKKLAQQKRDFGFLAIETKEGNQLIGTVALQRYEPGEAAGFIVFENAPNCGVGDDPNRNEVELTYALGRAFWGQGYATEACQSLVACGFNEMGVWRFVNSVNSQNVRSMRLMQRLGFNLQPNMHPRPFANSDAPGVIGILSQNVT